MLNSARFLVGISKGKYKCVREINLLEYVGITHSYILAVIVCTIWKNKSDKKGILTNKIFLLSTDDDHHSGRIRNCIQKKSK